MDDIEKPEEALTMDEAGDKVFDKFTAAPEPEAAPAPEKTEDPAPEPIVKGDDEKVAWLKSLDEKTLTDYREGKAIPKWRLDEALQRIKAYESFGSPEELSAKLKNPSPAPAPAPEAELSPEDKEVRDHMLKMFPFLKDIPKTTEEFTKFREQFNEGEKYAAEQFQAERQELLASAEQSATRLLEEAGIDVKNPELLNMHLDNIANMLAKDKEAERKFLNRDLSVLKPLVEKYNKLLYGGIQRKAKSEILQANDKLKPMPKAPIKGGAPEPEPDKNLNPKQAMDAMAEKWFEAAKS